MESSSSGERFSGLPQRQWSTTATTAAMDVLVEGGGRSGGREEEANVWLCFLGHQKRREKLRKFHGIQMGKAQPLLLDLRVAVGSSGTIEQPASRVGVRICGLWRDPKVFTPWTVAARFMKSFVLRPEPPSTLVSEYSFPDKTRGNF